MHYNETESNQNQSKKDKTRNIRRYILYFSFYISFSGEREKKRGVWLPLSPISVIPSPLSSIKHTKSNTTDY